jgi:hypothetical protein
MVSGFPPQAWTGEDLNGGEDMVMLPPPLPPPTREGNSKDAIHSLGKPRGILTYFDKFQNKITPIICFVKLDKNGGVIKFQST